MLIAGSSKVVKQKRLMGGKPEKQNSPVQRDSRIYKLAELLPHNWKAADEKK